MIRLLEHIRKSLTAKLMLVTGSILFAGTATLFTVMGFKNQELLYEQVKSQARILFRQIVLTRRWIADHGGVFIEKRPGIEPNPFLENNMIEDQEGNRYVRENPALITRYLSEYARMSGFYWFNLTSLRPVNPANKPDPFEEKSLLEFSLHGKKEATMIGMKDKMPVFRYIAPLFTEPACLKCHGDYQVGQVRGALSISIPIDTLLLQIQENQRVLIAGGLAVAVLLFFSLFIFLRLFVLRPLAVLKHAMEEHEPGPVTPLIPVENEIGSLARSFDAMQEKIRGYQETLEQEVAKATCNLTEANHRLEEIGHRFRNLSENKSDFIARISHELRTPLTSIRGAVEYLLATLGSLPAGRGPETKDLSRFAVIIASNSDRMERMVNETLDLEKIETGRTDFACKDFDLGQAVEETMGDLSPLLQSKEIRIEQKIEPGISMNGDPDRIKDMVSNLVVNGFDHSPPGGRLDVNCWRDKHTAVITVRDQGPGVAPELHEKIFEKFYKKRKEGTGLGLALCRAIATAHNGSVRVESDGKNGANFIVHLPLSVTDHDDPNHNPGC